VYHESQSLPSSYAILLRSRSGRLRPRGHNNILPTCTNSLHGQSFINRTLTLFEICYTYIVIVCLIMFTCLQLLTLLGIRPSTHRLLFITVLCSFVMNIVNTIQHNTILRGKGLTDWRMTDEDN